MVKRCICLKTRQVGSIYCHVNPGPASDCWQMFAGANPPKVMFFFLKKVTPPKTNIDTKNDGLDDVSPASDMASF